jgi:GNAT superfamily N-acetyltransferase
LEWQHYDEIRRRELFEARGRVGVYQSNHPDEFVSGHHPLLFFLNGQPIGVIRIDLPEDQNIAFFRLIAISIHFQKQGHGTALMGYAENYAAGADRTIFKLDSALEALSFYQKLGYISDPRAVNLKPGTVALMKAHRKAEPVRPANALKRVADGRR